MNDLVLFGKALADPTRIRILAALRNGELCVCELCDAMEMTQSTLSSHLQVIRQAGLVTTRKDGKWVNYSLDDGQARLIDEVFAHHAPTLKADKRLERDGKRVQERLKLRTDGRCVLGFNLLDSARMGVGTLGASD